MGVYRGRTGYMGKRDQGLGEFSRGCPEKSDAACPPKETA